jgi:hypothetical protein
VAFAQEFPPALIDGTVEVEPHVFGVVADGAVGDCRIPR